VWRNLETAPPQGVAQASFFVRTQYHKGDRFCLNRPQLRDRHLPRASDLQQQGFAMLVSILVIRASESGGAAIVMPWQMAVGVFFLTLAMCVLAAMVSINKVTTIDPAMVFKG
jgi:hypothetical protein